MNISCLMFSPLSTLRSPHTPLPTYSSLFPALSGWDADTLAISNTVVREDLLGCFDTILRLPQSAGLARILYRVIDSGAVKNNNNNNDDDDNNDDNINNNTDDDEEMQEFFCDSNCHLTTDLAAALLAFNRSSSSNSSNSSCRSRSHSRSRSRSPSISEVDDSEGAADVDDEIVWASRSSAKCLGTNVAAYFVEEGGRRGKRQYRPFLGKITRCVVLPEIFSINLRFLIFLGV